MTRSRWIVIATAVCFLCIALDSKSAEGCGSLHWVAVLPRVMALHSGDSARSCGFAVGSVSTWRCNSVQGSDFA